MDPKLICQGWEKLILNQFGITPSVCDQEIIAKAKPYLNLIRDWESNHPEGRRLVKPKAGLDFKEDALLVQFKKNGSWISFGYDFISIRKREFWNLSLISSFPCEENPKALPKELQKYLCESLEDLPCPKNS